METKIFTLFDPNIRGCDSLQCLIMTLPGVTTDEINSIIEKTKLIDDYSTDDLDRVLKEVLGSRYIGMNWPDEYLEW